MAIKQKYKSSKKLLMVEPVVNDVRNNCRKIKQESRQFIDEQMIPAKTKKSGIWQYMTNKIHKWGFKNFVRVWKSGIIFFLFLQKLVAQVKKNLAPRL